PDDLDRKVEILGHLRHDAQLLVVLLAEKRQIGRDLREKLGDHRGNAAKKVGAKLVLETGFCGSIRGNTRRKSVRIHGLNRRRPDKIDFLCTQNLYIRGKTARITGEILVRRKLSRIDEN